MSENQAGTIRADGGEIVVSPGSRGKVFVSLTDAATGTALVISPEDALDLAVLLIGASQEAQWGPG